MAGLSNYAQVALLNHLLRNSALTSPTTVYMGLNSADPGETGANELTAANGYAREAMSFAAAVAKVAATDTAIEFAASGADWTQSTHWTIWDAASGGNCLASGALDSPRTVTDGETATFAAGSLTVTAGAGYSTYLGNAWLDHLLSNVSFTSPTTVYTSLHAGDPGLTGANELADQYGYARSATAWDAPTGNNNSVNSDAETWTASGGDFAAASHWGVFDSGTVGAGNFLLGGELVTSKTILDGETGTIAAGSLSVTVD